MKLGLFLLPAFFTDASDVKQPSRTDFAIFLTEAILLIHPIYNFRDFGENGHHNNGYFRNRI